MTDLALATQQESGTQVTERVSVEPQRTTNDPTTLRGPRLGRQEMLGAARAFIESGYHLTLLYGTTAEGVCECRLGLRCKSPGKHPQERGWTTRPIRTAADLAARWERTGGTPNIGVMPDDGLVVIDVDRKNGKRGAESLAALEAELGPLGEPHQTTASRGLHYVFRVPPETDAASLPNRTDVAEGIDILRVGRQFVAAPSQIGTRRYAGCLPPRDELPVLPPAWVANLQAQGGNASANQAPTDPRALEERLAALKAPSAEKVREVVACIPNVLETDRSKYVWLAHAIKGACGGEATGEGLDIFTAWAGEWPGSVDPVEDERVFVSIRRENVHTGWPDLLRLAEQHGYDSTADRLAELHGEFSALAKPEAAAGEAPSSTAAAPHELHDLLVALHECLKTIPDPLRRESIRDEWLARIQQKLRIPFAVLRERLAAFDAPHRRYKPRIVRPGRELRDAMSQAPQQALVPQYIYAEMQHVLYGTPQSLKTFTALDLGLHIASGLPWLGRVPVIQRGVVFFAGEAATSLWVRIAAWCAARGIQVEAAADLPFALIDAVPTLGRGDDGLQDAIARVEEAMRPFSVPIGLVVLDNMTRMAAASGLSTTDTGQYGSILAGIDALGRATKAGTLTIYHVPVSDQSRPAGTYQTTANPDVIIRAERPEATEPRIILRMAPPHGKSRGGPPARDLVLPFKVQDVVPWLTSSFEREGCPLPATLASAPAGDLTCVAPSAYGSAGIVLPKTADSLVSEALRQQFTSLVVDVEAIAKSGPATRSAEVTKEDADVRLVLEACETCPGASGQTLRAACGGRGKDIDAAAFTAIKRGLAEDRRRSNGAHDYHLTDPGREWLKAARARDVDEATDTAAALAALDQPA